MAIVYDEANLARFMVEGVKASEGRPVLIDKFLEDAIEVDVDCVADGETAVIGAIMEHVEMAGVHSGDSACMIPTLSLSDAVLADLRRHTYDLARELKVCGLMNVQYAVKGDAVFILEVNPRASRTVPFVSKAIGVPLAKLAALAMAGYKLRDLGFTREIRPRHFAVKEAVLPFVRFLGADIVLSPEMKSTGEVMGIDMDVGIAYHKSQEAAGNPLPEGGNILLSVCKRDQEAMVPLARILVELGYALYATDGTATVLRNHDIKARAVFKLSQGRPNALDMIADGELGWIINTPTGAAPQQDEVRMRVNAVMKGVPITTTMNGVSAAIQGLQARTRLRDMTVCSLQEYNRHTPFDLDIAALPALLEGGAP
jgi:carbamoyl-phosphate synthase large subunit